MRSFLVLLLHYAMLPLGIGVLALLWFAPILTGSMPGVFFGFLGLTVNCVAIYVFLRQRIARQDELAYVLMTAIHRNLPLIPALRSYAQSSGRPGYFLRLLDWLVCLVLPFYAYVRIWIGWKRYPRLIDHLLEKLEHGVPLSDALASTPGLMDREMTLAIAVGERTGESGESLAAILNATRPERTTAGWLELAPQVMYPVLLLLTILGLTSFLSLMILPRYKRIFQEFSEELPATTTAVFGVSSEIVSYFPLAFLGFVVLTTLVIVHPMLRWTLPGVRRFYRWGIQGVILQTLGRLFIAGRTVPEALDFLKANRSFPGVVQDRLQEATNRVNRGEPLEVALHQSELLPANMVPLVKAAQATQTLPWALAELGDHLAARSLRTVRRIVSLVSPICVVLIGVWVGFLTYGLLLPLIHLLNKLSGQ